MVAAARWTWTILDVQLLTWDCISRESIAAAVRGGMAAIALL